MPLLDPGGLANKSTVTGPVSVCFPIRSRDRT
jgi:hypothetical protein